MSNGGAPLRQLVKKFSGLLTRAAKLTGLLLLGVACTASGIAFLLSFAIAMPVLAEQFKSWLETGRWSEITHSTMSSTPQPNGLLGLMAYLLLSWEAGYLILATAGLFGGAVWVFQAARSRFAKDVGNDAG
jgi:hypothetical protein